MKRKFRCFTSLLLVTCSILFISCSKIGLLANNIKKNIDISKTLQEYTLNETNFKEISLNDKTYIIDESSISLNNLNKPIGKVSKEVTIDENNKALDKDELMKIYVVPNNSEEKRIHLNFGWIPWW